MPVLTLHMSYSMGRGGGESNHREFKYYRGESPPGLTLPLSPESPTEPPLMRRGRDDEEDEGKAEPPLMRRGDGDADDEPPLMRRRSDGDEDDEEEEAKAEPPLARRGRDDHDGDSDDDDGGRDAEAKASSDAPRRPQPRPPSNDLFLDFDASVTEGGAPSDAVPSSSSSFSAARATAAAAFGRYQHRRRTVEDVERDDTVVQLTASPRPLPASDDEAEGGEREREAASPRRPKPALPGGTAAEVVDKVRAVGCEEGVESCASSYILVCVVWCGCRRWATGGRACRA